LLLSEAFTAPAGSGDSLRAYEIVGDAIPRALA
jgi:hypothetical protein